MELIEYLRFIKRYIWWLLAAAVVGIALGLTYSYIQKDAYKATMSLFVQRQPDASTSSTQYYTYDGFYAQQTAAAYTDNALKLLTSEEIISRAAKEAGLPSDAKSVAALRGTIATKKDAPQLIQLAVVMPNKDDAAAFTQGLATSLKARTTELNQEGDTRLAVDPVNPQPFVILVRPLWWLYGLAAGFFLLLVTLVVTAAWDYTRHHRHKS